MPMRPFPHITCWARARRFEFGALRLGALWLLAPKATKTSAANSEASRAAGFGMEAKRRIMLGSYLLSSGVYEKYYYPAQQVRTLITQDYQVAYEKCDVILAPTSPRTAFVRRNRRPGRDTCLTFSRCRSIAGNGGMSVPCGLAAIGPCLWRAAHRASVQGREHVLRCGGA